MTALRLAAQAGIVWLGAMSGTLAASVPATPVTPVRVGEHPGYGRIVFDLPAGTVSNVVVEGERVLMTFQGAGAVLQPGDLPRNVRSIRTGADTAMIEVLAGVRARPIRIGDRLVIDLLDAKPNGSGPKGQSAQPKPATPRPVPPKVAPAASEGAAPGPTVTLPAAPVPAAVPVLPTAGPGGSPKDIDDKDREPGRLAAVVPAAVSQEALAAPAIDVTRPGATSFLIKADSDVGAASFRRGEMGLVVLDRRLAEQAVPSDVIWTRGTTNTVLRVPVPPGTGLRVTRGAEGWSIERVPGWQAETLSQKVEGAAIAMAMTRPGRMAAVLDPVTGGTLLVGTSLGTDRGVPEGRRTPEYRVLPSWLGIVVDPSSDLVDLRPGSAGFLLQAGMAVAAAPTLSLSRRFDLPNEPVQALGNRLRAQLASAATAPPRARSAERIAAVQSMIALGMGVEAQALVQQVVAEDPQQAADAQTAALAAVAAVLAGRPGEAAALDDARLDGTAEIGLWRGLRDRKQGVDSAAARSLGTMTALAMAYPQSLRRLVWSEVAEAAVEAGRSLPAEDSPAFAKALQLERAGDVDGALAAYEAVAAGSDRLDQVRATARAAELRLASARIKPADAAAILERQGFAWRGDRLEVAFRLRAAELRSAAQEWRTALEGLRAIDVAYPDQKEVVRRHKVDVMQAMLGATGGGMTAVDVILLAADYQDCVPDGEAGLAMARLLADKLAALDLPSRTIPILQGLVRATQPGEARAQFGARLGELLLDAGDAPGATAALQASASAPIGPELQERRSLLAARLLAYAGDVTGAAAALVELDTGPADELRAGILAKAGDWRGSLAALTDLVSKRVPKDGALDGVAQDLLVRQADAAARAGAADVLQRLRPSIARLDGARADVFRLLTAAPLDSGADLRRGATELAAARGMPQRLQAAGLR